MIDVIEGRVHRLKHFVDINDIYPRLRIGCKVSETVSFLFENYTPQMQTDIRPGDIIVAGKCFGFGPYRREALAAFHQAGIKCVVAISFGRQFYRCCINQGIPPIVSSEARGKIKDGETIQIDLNRGNICMRKEILEFEPFPDPLDKILAAGGLIPWLSRS